MTAQQETSKAPSEMSIVGLVLGEEMTGLEEFPSIKMSRHHHPVHMRIKFATATVMSNSVGRWSECNWLARLKTPS